MDMDLDDNGQYSFQLEPLANAIMETIPEYVLLIIKEMLCHMLKLFQG